MRSEGDKEPLESAVDDLMEYTRTDFNMVEDLLRKYDFPKLEAIRKFIPASLTR